MYLTYFEADLLAVEVIAADAAGDSATVEDFLDAAGLNPATPITYGIALSNALEMRAGVARALLAEAGGVR